MNAATKTEREYAAGFVTGTSHYPGTYAIEDYSEAWQAGYAAGMKLRAPGHCPCNVCTGKEVR